MILWVFVFVLIVIIQYLTESECHVGDKCVHIVIFHWSDQRKWSRLLIVRTILMHKKETRQFSQRSAVKFVLDVSHALICAPDMLLLWTMEKRLFLRIYVVIAVPVSRFVQ